MLLNHAVCPDHISCLYEWNISTIKTRLIPGPVGKFASFHLRHIPQPHYIPGRWYRPNARHILPLGVPTGDVAGEQLVQQGVAQAFGGGDVGLGALDGLVDGVQHGGDGPLLRQWWEEEGERLYGLRLNALLPCGTTEAPRTFIDVERLSQYTEQVARVDVRTSANDMKLGGAEAEASY